MEACWEGGLLHHVDNFKLSCCVYVELYNGVYERDQGDQLVEECCRPASELSANGCALDVHSLVKKSDCSDVGSVFLVLLLAWADQEC